MKKWFEKRGSCPKKHRFGGCHHHQEDGDGNLLPVLSEFPVGSKCKVISLMGHMMNKRLANMGLGVGSIIEVIKNDPSGGPMIIFADSVRIAVGRGMARHICCEGTEEN
jgi:Fe2+ transport system protein FeoA